MSIKKNLHVVDNSQQLDNRDPNFDRTHKVRPLLNIIKDNFRKIPKEEKLSADEQIIPFKGRSIMKQYMPQKPNRWGYKMFMLAGAQTGVCFDFIFLLERVAKRRTDFAPKSFCSFAKQCQIKSITNGFSTIITLLSNCWSSCRS